MHHAQPHMQKINFAMLRCSISEFPANARTCGARQVPCRRSKKGKQAMSIFFLAAAATLTLSLGVGAAMAEPAPVRQKMQTASTQIDIGGSHQIGNRRRLASGGSEHLGTTMGAFATQPAIWHQEPESINRGTEP
jgi:hypothetical protein